MVSLVQSVYLNDFDSTQFLLKVFMPKSYQPEIKTITSQLLKGLT